MYRAILVNIHPSRALVLRHGCRITDSTTLRSHFGSSRGHSWPGLSQWLSHPLWVWFEATRESAQLHVWPVAWRGRTVSVPLAWDDVGSATTTIRRRTRRAALTLRLPLSGFRVVFAAWNESWSRSGLCWCRRFSKGDVDGLVGEQI